ncbi:hypothetical protein [Actinophytocola sediminis]
MGTALVVVIVLVVLGVLGFAVALARKGRRRATEALTLAPGAPREWAGAHSPEAKLHRRLVAAARSLAALPLGNAAEIEHRVTVEQQIRQLDEQLVAAAAVPQPQRDAAVAQIEPLVSAVETSAAGIAAGRVDLELLRRTQAELEAGDR